MRNPLIRKLSNVGGLSGDDRNALDALCGSPVECRAGSHLIRDGDRPEHMFLMVEGWGYRYKMMRGGQRQIMAYLLPGDQCDPQSFILDEMDHSIALLSDARVVAIPKKIVVEITDRRPAIARAFRWAAQVDMAVLREWLVSIGQRDAHARLAHLFCELWQRMAQVGLTVNGAFDLPLTQEQLGDTVGLTAVHVNRTLQTMRAEGLVTIQSKRIVIHDMDRMREAAGFDPRYLHLTPRG